MKSEVVLNARRSRLHALNPVRYLRSLFAARHALNSDDDLTLEKERLLSRALTNREQKTYRKYLGDERDAYKRHFVSGREAIESVLHASRESLDRAHCDLTRATELVRDSAIGEAKELSRLRTPQHLRAISK